MKSLYTAAPQQEAEHQPHAPTKRTSPAMPTDSQVAMLALPSAVGNWAFRDLIQAKLTISQPGDPYEQEADRVAEAVMRMPEPTEPVQSPCPCGGTPGSKSACTGCQLRPMMLQRRASEPTEPSTMPPVVHEVLRSPGRPLEPAVNASMGARFGYDFSRVRVHTDANAAESAQAVNALAFTVMRDVVFALGKYKPYTNEGRHLIAHELTHVIQQDSTSRRVREFGLMNDKHGTKVNRDLEYPMMKTTPISLSFLQKKTPDKPVKPAQVAKKIPHSEKTKGESKKRKPSLVERVEVLEERQKVLDMKLKALSALENFKDKVEKRAISWIIVANDIGSEYALAAQKHRDAVVEHEKAKALEVQLYYSILTVVAIGGLAWVSTGLQAGGILKEHALLLNVLEDSIQGTFSESSNFPTLLITPLPTVNIEPQVFQNERVNVVLRAKQDALDYFIKVRANLTDNDTLEFWNNYDEKKANERYQAWLEAANLLAGEAQLPKKGEMSKVLERGIWAKWAPRTLLGVHYAIFPMLIEEEITDPVKERLSHLHINATTSYQLRQWAKKYNIEEEAKLINKALMASP